MIIIGTLFTMALDEEFTVVVMFVTCELFMVELIVWAVEIIIMVDDVLLLAVH
jgi:hypothetical protein